MVSFKEIEFIILLIGHIIRCNFAISDYDLWAKYVPQPVEVKQESVYDYYDILEELGRYALYLLISFVLNVCLISEIKSRFCNSMFK